MDDKIYFQWHITDACNSRCRHCYQDDFNATSELELPDLIKVYENIASSAGDRKIVINLTGGEPFLKKDFFDLLRYLDGCEETQELLIITNGSLIDGAVLEDLGTISKLRQVKISLDGADPKRNDSIRRRGAFASAVEAIGLIKSNTAFEAIIMFTAMRSNFDCLPALFELCRDLKVDGLIIERFIPLGQARAMKEEVLDKERWKILTNEIFGFFGVPIAQEFVLPHKAFWLNFRGDIELLAAECNLGESNFAVMPNADVFPCRRLNLKVGNLLENNLSDIINNSSIIKDLCGKANLKGKCGTCRLANCRGCRALAYALESDYLGEDSQCWIEDIKEVH